MADVGNFTAWSSTAAINSPSGSTAVSTGLDDNLREIQAQVAVWRDGTGYGILTVTSVSGSNTITGSTSPAPALAANQKFLLQPAGTNTGATTLNLNGAGAKNVYACNAALNGGEFHTSVPVLLEYDGTAFQVLGPVSKQQTRTTYSSGSGTYSLPGGCTRLVVRLVGGGGAGGPGGGAGAANGTAGGDTTFGVLTAGSSVDAVAVVPLLALALGLWALFLMYCALHASIKNGKFYITLFPWPVRSISYALLFMMVGADAVFNLTIGSIVFLELPKSWMFTTSCSSHLEESGWRGDLARWICNGWLNPFEEGHC
jgi:hypothetical protein